MQNSDALLKNSMNIVQVDKSGDQTHHKL